MKACLRRSMFTAVCTVQLRNINSMEGDLEGVSFGASVEFPRRPRVFEVVDYVMNTYPMIFEEIIFSRFSLNSDLSTKRGYCALVCKERIAKPDGVSSAHSDLQDG